MALAYYEEINENVKFLVVMLTSMKMVDFWAVPLYSLVDAEDVSGKLQLPS
jgi:hypothetical protein